MPNQCRKIFVFDDDHDMLKAISQNIELINGIAIKCNSIYIANEKWKTHYSEISGVIIDLMMPTDGFTPEQRERTNHSKITGWIWFIDNVINGNFTRQDLIRRTLFFSGFLPDLEQSVTLREYEYLLTSVQKLDKEDNKRWELLQDFMNRL